MNPEATIEQRLGEDYRAFADGIGSPLKWYRHTNVLASVCDRITKDELKRVMVFLPPQYGKSQTSSRILPAYYLYKHPKRQVGIISYGANLAEGMNREARENYRQTGLKLNENVSGVGEWQTAQRGGSFAMGIGGAIYGKGADLWIIDDPVKNDAEAFSPTVQLATTTWADSTFYSRLRSHSAVLLIMTRWTENDLAGHWLRQSIDRGESWHVVIFDETHSLDPYNIPSNCTIEPDWRKEGEILCPEMFDEKTVIAKRKAMKKFYLPLCQQRPTALEGDVWKLEWFEPFDLKDGEITARVGGNNGHDGTIATFPRSEVLDTAKDWDLAYTENQENSGCAYVEAGRRGVDAFIFDVDWKWVEFPKLIGWMKNVSGPNFVEAKASGKSAVQTLKASGFHAQEVKVPGGDKVSRARLSTVLVTGKIYVRREIFDRMLYDPEQGIMFFPGGKNSDLNDTFVQALNRLFRKEKVRWGILT